MDKALHQFIYCKRPVYIFIDIHIRMCTYAYTYIYITSYESTDALTHPNWFPKFCPSIGASPLPTLHLEHKLAMQLHIRESQGSVPDRGEQWEEFAPKKKWDPTKVLHLNMEDVFHQPLWEELTTFETSEKEDLNFTLFTWCKNTFPQQLTSM